VLDVNGTEQAMCGTSAVGNTGIPAANTMPPTTTSVAGASGAATPTTGGGGSGALTTVLATLTELVKTIQSLSQALAGTSILGGGGAATNAADPMAGCPMMAGNQAAEGADVAGAAGGGVGAAGHGHTEAGGPPILAPGVAQKFTLPGSTTGVGGESGAGAPGKYAPSSTVGGAYSMPPMKYTDVGGESGAGTGGKVTQVTPPPAPAGKSVTDARTGVEAATTRAADKAAALTKANDDVTAKTTAVTGAEGAVAAAEAAKTAADANVVSAAKALANAKAKPTTHTASSGETFESIATKYGTTVDALRTLNPELAAESNPAALAGKVVKLPANTSGINAAQSALDTATAAAVKAAKDLEAARLALEAAKAALEAAKVAAAEAKKQSEDAQAAVTVAQQALDSAIVAEKSAADAVAKATVDLASAINLIDPGADPAGAEAQLQQLLARVTEGSKLPAGDARTTAVKAVMDAYAPNPGASARVQEAYRNAMVTEATTALNGGASRADRDAIYHKYESIGLSEPDRVELFRAFAATLTGPEQEELGRFFGGIAAASSDSSGGSDDSGDPKLTRDINSDGAVNGSDDLDHDGDTDDTDSKLWSEAKTAWNLAVTAQQGEQVRAELTSLRTERATLIAERTNNTQTAATIGGHARQSYLDRNTAITARIGEINKRINVLDPPKPTHGAY